MKKTKGVDFYDCTIEIWGGKNFKSDVFEGGNILILWGPTLNSK